jgi:2-C-methyl-D-erythritol 4-phosphate cytidylyltransferase
MRRVAYCWAVIPAAGVGRRFGAGIPKQYLELAGRLVIEHAVGVVLGHPRIEGVVVALDPEDAYWARTALAGHHGIIRADGGAERCHSVLNALGVLAACADDDDWVLVHDAARPCLRAADVDRLLNALRDHPVGGLLGVPVRDTMKEAGAGNSVLRTVRRDRLWHAFTPQMFRLGLLRRALGDALGQGRLVTDDASAIERMGLAPLLVEGHADNIKITRPEDLPLARFFLEQQGGLCG